MIDKNAAENALIIFIKNPQLGKVKTRLAKTVGDEKALEIYLELSKITRENCQVLSQNTQILRGGQPYVFYSDFINIHDDWSNEIFEKAVQSGDDLGDRMLNAFALILKNHAKACIIGSDCPTLSVEILQSAFEALNNHDFVVGPSTDGGYYLLGMNADIPPQYWGFQNSDFGFRDTLPKSDIPNPKSTPPQYLFENMVWSTENVLPETLKRIKAQGKIVALLPELTDIDEEKDWLNYLKMISYK